MLHKSVLLLALCAICGSQAVAQSGYVLTSFHCIPSVCEDQGPPATTSSATVVFDAQCSHAGAVTQSFSGQVNVFVQNCSTAYVPFAKVETYRTTHLDDCGSPYDVDTLRESGEVFSASGAVIYHASQEVSCDGGTTGTTIFGQKPC